MLKAWGLVHENFFFQGPIKESIMHIKLVNGPLMCESKSKNKANGDWFNDRAKGLCEVETFLLVKSFRHKPGFVPLNGVIWVFFEFENPLTPNGFPIGW